MQYPLRTETQAERRDNGELRLFSVETSASISEHIHVNPAVLFKDSPTTIKQILLSSGGRER